MPGVSSAINGGSIVWILDAETGAFSRALLTAEAEAKATSKAIDKTAGSSFESLAKKGVKAFDDVAGAIASLAMKASILTVTFGALGGLGVYFAGEIESAQMGFKTLLGTAEKAQAAIDMIKKDAASTPFNFTELVKANQLMTSVTGDAAKSERIILNVGKALAAMGKGNDELNRITVNMQQIAQLGKAQEIDMKQFAYAGINAYQLVADSMGITIEQATKLQDDGLLTAEILYDAFEKASNGSGKFANAFVNAAGTWKQLWSNMVDIMQQSLAQIATDSGLFDFAKQSLQNFTDWITAHKDDISKFIKGSFQWLQANWGNIVAAIGGIAAAFAAMKFANIIIGLVGVVKGIGQFVTALNVGKGAVAAFTAVTAVNPFILIATAIAALIAGLVFLQIKFDWIGKTVRWLSTEFKPLWDILGQIANFIGGIFKEAWDNIVVAFNQTVEALKPFSKELKIIGIALLVGLVGPMTIAIATVTAIVVAIAWVVGQVAKHWKTLGPIIMIPFYPIMALYFVFAKLVEGIIWFVSNIGNMAKAVGDFFNMVITSVVGFFTGLWNGVVSIFTSIYNTIVTVMTAIWNFIAPILNFIKNLYIIVWGSILLFIITVVQTIWDFIVNAWNSIAGFFGPILTSIWNAITATFTGIWNTVSSVFNSVLAFVQNVWNDIYNSITNIVNNIINFFAPAFNWLVGAGRDIVNGLANGISSTASGVWNAIKGVADQIGKFFGGAINWLYDVGKNIIQGLINGIAGMAGEVAATVENIATDIVGNIKEKLNIHSPSRVMVEMGGFITQGLVDGLNKGAENIRRASSNIALNVQEPISAQTGIDQVSDIGYVNNTDNTNKTEIVYNINEINIASEVDGDAWLKKLTNNQEITSKGLVPQQGY